MEKPIKLLKPRDLGETLNESFRFIKLYYKAFMAPIIFVVLPLLIFASYGFVQYFKLMGNIMKGGDTGIAALGSSAIITFVGYVGYVAGSLLLLLIVAECFIAIEKSADGKVTGGDIFEGIKRDLLRFIGFIIALTIVISFGFVAMVGIGFAMYKIHVGVMVFYIVAAFIAFFYSMVVLSITPFVYLREDVNPFKAIGRSFHLVRGNWWGTFGVIFVATTVLQIVSMVFVIPFYVMFALRMLHSVQDGTAAGMSGMFELTPLQAISFMFMMVGISVLSAFVYVVTNIKYYSLVETKDGEGLLSEIQSISYEENPGQL